MKAMVSEGVGGCLTCGLIPGKEGAHLTAQRCIDGLRSYVKHQRMALDSVVVMYERRHQSIIEDRRGIVKALLAVVDKAGGSVDITAERYAKDHKGVGVVVQPSEDGKSLKVMMQEMEPPPAPAAKEATP